MSACSRMDDSGGAEPARAYQKSRRRHRRRRKEGASSEPSRETETCAGHSETTRVGPSNAKDEYIAYDVTATCPSGLANHEFRETLRSSPVSGMQIPVSLLSLEMASASSRIL